MKNITKYLTLGIFAFGLTSCLEDENIEEQKYGLINLNASKVVEIPTATKSFSLLLEDKPTTLEVVNVHLAAEEPAAEDITVTLAVDPSSTFPAARYTFPNGLTAVIPKGSKDAKVNIAFNANDLNPSTPYRLVMNIVSVSPAGYIVSGNYAKRTITFSAKNAYEGTYRATGRFTHPVASASRDIARDKTITTVNANTSRIEIGDLAGAAYYMYIRVNADNTVTILPDADPATATTDVFPDGTNTYDPATKTFTLNYAYNSAAPRKIREVVVKK